MPTESDDECGFCRGYGAITCGNCGGTGRISGDDDVDVEPPVTQAELEQAGQQRLKIP